MRIAVIGNESVHLEVLQKKTAKIVEWIWERSIDKITRLNADAIFDFEFTHDSLRIQQLLGISPMPVFINAVSLTLLQIDAPFIRFNGWPNFFDRDLIEMVVPNEKKDQVQIIFDTCNWQYRLVKDVPGMITARVISMIVNEAYFTFEQQVSSKEEIDVAMKLGTNYPFGPFEWSKKIGLEKIAELLLRLRSDDDRYEISELLIREAGLIGNNKHI